MRGVFLKVKDIITKSDFKLKENNTFYEAAQLFSNNKVEVIPILDKKETLVGVITKNDIINNFIKGTSPDTYVKYLLRGTTNIINEDSEILDCIDKVEGYMAVKNADGKFSGILSMNKIYKQRLENALEKICELKKRLNCIYECDEANLNCTELNKIIESSYDGIYITDGKANTLRINKSYENITGLQRKNMLTRNMYDLEKEGYISKSSTLMVLKTRKSNTIEQEFSTGKKVLVSSNPIFDDKSNINMVVTNVRDITELYELEEQLAKNRKLTEKYYSEIEAMRMQYLNLTDMVANDKVMINLLEVAKRVANVDTTVLILGETGVGKEEIAKFVYKNSKRKRKNFIKINCGAIPQTLIESELFGYVKGAFTGANKEGKMGLFEVADGGTVFLDEIGELPLDIQVKLLNVLQEGEVERIGAVKPIKIDVRVLAATNRNLEEMIKDKTFRADLYYRLNVVPLTVPPLRDRREDIVPLIQHFLSQLNIKYNFEKTFTIEALNTLYNYNWLGNVRELKNIVERVIVMSCGNKIFKSDLPIKMSPNTIEKDTECKEIGNLKDAVEKVEIKLIRMAFDNAGNVRDAAKILGINSSTFFRKRKRYLEMGML
ncbi:PAS domain S-box protein [Clostridium estertheticum]|uniref:PAS domain S-box protein n=1 Tax=Clostridium estertheticum TaxID=238834 RepID=A0A5N7J225_9CLOT|nr:sigma 54-interacting transcriptional regulator [Clostridium estertheticum]MBU3164371.1 sigma 54-interacting transcriptional regulator [Clostridium estertheticum]MBU3170978.1 sigma 54-interacting transcriptional regulator [Clostridium estertheticum]MPQ32098.1 PAS domain S-box protein [Clostridium estertheticum]MPQ62758.1 PAS domain S-box protein [Clostridium estertheticum]